MTPATLSVGDEMEKTARDICRELCAQRGEPACFQIGPFPNEECDEPECIAAAKTREMTTEPMTSSADALLYVKQYLVDLNSDEDYESREPWLRAIASIESALASLRSSIPSPSMDALRKDHAGSRLPGLLAALDEQDDKLSADAAKAIRSLSTRLREAEEALAWCDDMSKAPKDGTAVLAADWKIDNDGAVVYWDLDGDRPYRWRLSDGDIAFHDDRFTHWMLIPPVRRARALSGLGAGGKEKMK